MAERRRVAVIGSRNFNNDLLIERVMMSLCEENHVIVSGGHPFSGTSQGKASGVDYKAMFRAWHLGMNIIPIPAHWDHHGNGAGFIRNPLIADVAHECIAFYDGESSGTRDTINHFRRLGKKITIYNENGDSNTERAFEVEKDLPVWEV